MIDALLYAFRDAIRGANFGYGEAACEIMADGQPPARCGNTFVAVHSDDDESKMDNALDEYFTVLLTLTVRVTVPADRVGDQQLARSLARRRGPDGSLSFNGRCEQLRAFLHMNWGVLQDANQNLIQWTPDNQIVYGFCEPCRYKGRETAQWCRSDWFEAKEGQGEIGLKSEMVFADARRLQPTALYV